MIMITTTSFIALDKCCLVLTAIEVFFATIRKWPQLATISRFSARTRNNYLQPGKFVWNKRWMQLATIRNPFLQLEAIIYGKLQQIR